MIAVSTSRVIREVVEPFPPPEFQNALPGDDAFAELAGLPGALFSGAHLHPRIASIRRNHCDDDVRRPFTRRPKNKMAPP
jgi:hypothetical protein